MITYMVINDLGKIKSIVEEIQKRSGVVDVDHDNLLLLALEQHPDISPSFQRLSPQIKTVMLKGLRAKFNIGQFLQAENVPASLTGLKGLDQKSLDFYLLHALADIGGAAGHVNSNGSIVMTNPTYEGFKLGIQSIETFLKGSDEIAVYNDFLSQKARAMGLNFVTKSDVAITKLAVMMRLSSLREAKHIVEIFNKLPTNTQAILSKELNMSGINDGFATLIYYAPALLQNIKTAHLEKDPTSLNEALSEGFTTLARIYQKARIQLRNRHGNGVYTVLASKIAEAGKTANRISNAKIELKEVGSDAEAFLVAREIGLQTGSIGFAKELSSRQRIAVVGIGGGSDGVQAAQLAILFKKAGKKVVVISVRTEKTGSQGANGKMNEQRTIVNHGGELMNTPGVYKVLPHTSGAGRFLENLPASEVESLIVLDKQDGTLAGQLNNAINTIQADAVISVDTGGDSLYKMSSSDLQQAKATPDQDLRVLKALQEIQEWEHMRGENTFFVSSIIAVGVDSPDYAFDSLAKVHAGLVMLNNEEKDSVLAHYKQWGMDGSSTERYGKTSLAWQAALNGKYGIQALPIPQQVVLDSKNPWDPFVHVDSFTAGIFMMPLVTHIEAISN